MKNFILLLILMFLGGMLFWGGHILYQERAERATTEGKRQEQVEKRKEFVKEYIKTSDGWAQVLAVHTQERVWFTLVIQNKDGVREVAYHKLEADPHYWVPVAGEDVLLVEDDQWRGTMRVKPKVK